MAEVDRYVAEDASVRAMTATLIDDENAKAVARLLGPVGEKVLADLIAVIRNVALREQLPLCEIRIQPVRDIEIPQWETVVIIASFESDFDAASRYVREMYPDIDEQIDRWTPEEQEYYWRVLSLDFEATATPRDTA